MSRNAKGDGSKLFDAPGGGYRGYITANGKRVYFTGRTKAEASQARRDLIARRDAGTLIPGTSHTVEGWMRHWLTAIANIRPTTRQTHEWVLEQRIVGTPLAHVKLSKLTPEHLEVWMRGLGVSPASQRRYVAPLRAALAAAVRRGHLAANPFDQVELGTLPRTHAKAMSADDIDAVLAAARGRNRVRWHLALKLGLRPGEALGLTWHDFDEQAGRLTIRYQLLRAKGQGLYLQDATKTAAGARTLRLPRHLVGMLIEHRAEQAVERDTHGLTDPEFDGVPVPLMFTQENGRPIDARMDTAEWKRLLDAAGLPRDRRYVARHTALSHMILLSGGNVALTAKNAGHADPAFTYRVYVHPLAESEEELADAMDAAPYAAPYDPIVPARPATLRAPADADL